MNIKINNRSIWITWETQRRSIELAKVFNAKLYIYKKKHKFNIIRYIFATLSTMCILTKENPKYVYAQNPSIVLALVLSILKPIYSYKLIIDRHSNFRFGSKNIIIDKIFFIISDYTIKKADYTMVTNDYLNNIIYKKGGTGLILQDKLPVMTSYHKITLLGEKNIVFVTSFGTDEPIDEVITAFKYIDNKIHLYITGNYNNTKYKYIVSTLTNNIHFTGYLPEDEYQSLIYSADALIVLTKSEHTLTCGAYEGISLCKPMVLSNTNAIKEYFTEGVIYCDPNYESIIYCIKYCLNNPEKMKTEIIRYKNRIEKEWQQRFLKTLSIIEKS